MLKTGQQNGTWPAEKGALPLHLAEMKMKKLV
jgi:hypothetical protein